MLRRVLFAVLLCCVAAAMPVSAADEFYFKAPIRTLNLLQGRLPADPQPQWGQFDLVESMRPYVALDQPGEAYIDLPEPDPQRGWSMLTVFTHDADLVIRVAQAGDVTGMMYVPATDFSGMVALQFSVPGSLADDNLRNDFFAAKEAHYQQLLVREIPGGAWFRRQATEARRARPGEPPAVRPQPFRRDWRRRQSDLSDTYALFSGGRALSENLQLDRVLPPAADAAGFVDLAEIEGITVREMDWTALIAGAQPQLDALASMIPADQHAVFFPSFDAAARLADEAEANGTPILRLLEPRAESARVKERYEKQLCLSISKLSRLLGPHVISSMAMTGSDPYFRTGTDLAILLESKDLLALRTLLLAQLKANAQGPAVRTIDGEIAGVKYTGATTPDRSICCHIATIGNAMIVTNSTAQLERIASAHSKHTASIASLPEYTFFRNRYQMGDEYETAFIFLSDAAIRRWCGPQWRIATSRRMRDAAVLAELQAVHFAALGRGEVESGPLHTQLPTAQIGEIRLTPRGVVSSTYNTLEFLTPIAEIKLDRVSKAEADAYGRWRDTYQRNWSQFFDPIAARLSIRDDKLTADLTVMPLILGTDYREFMELSRGAVIEPQDGDPHDALIHFIMAINTNSLPMQQAGGMIAMVAPNLANPLGWLGSSIAIYADDDPFWAELAAAPDDEKETFLEDNLDRLPVALHVKVKDQLRLAGFLTAMRAFAEQTAPGMTAWQNLTHNDLAYVRVSPTEPDMGMNASVYYASVMNGLVVTFSESLLKRALDRKAASINDVNGDAAPPATAEWLGTSMGLSVGGTALDLMAHLAEPHWKRTLQLQAWGNLPILNEWKRLFPDQDPVALHEQFWHTRLLCPGGGQFTWNEQFRTMESTAFGCPASPKTGPEILPVFQQYSSGNFGLSFENDSLRAKTELTRQRK